MQDTTILDLANCDLMYVADAIYMVLKGHDITKCTLANNALKKFPAKMITRLPDMTRKSSRNKHFGETRWPYFCRI